jgi:hypothetical protein
VTPAENQVASDPNSSSRCQSDTGHLGGSAAMMIPVVAVPIFGVNWK